MRDRQFTIWKKESTEHCGLRVTFGVSKRWYFTNGPWADWFGVRDGTWSAMEHKTEQLKIDKFLFLWGGRRIFSCRSWGKYGESYPLHGQEGANFILKARADFPETKKFRIMVMSQAGVSQSVPIINTSVQAERIYLKIEDIAEGETATYTYTGAGLAPDLPFGKGAAKVVGKLGGAAERMKKVEGAVGALGKGGVSAPGDWNNFDAPGWMSAYDFGGSATAGTVYSAGMGSSKSWNTFSFGGTDGMLIELYDFSTGATYALPQAAAFTTGRMSLDK